MSGVCPRPILNNEPVLKQTRGNNCTAPESPKSPEDPKEYIMTTDEQIAAIIAQVTVAMQRARVGAVATTHYVQNPYEVDINPGTPDGLNMYLKAVESKEKDEGWLKKSQSNSKAVVTSMKDLTEKFCWSVITSKIDDPKDPGNNLVNIYTSTRLLKIEHVKKKSLPLSGPQYW